MYQHQISHTTQGGMSVKENVTTERFHHQLVRNTRALGLIGIQGETKFAHKLSVVCDLLLKTSRKFCTTYVLRRLVFKIHVAVKWCKLSNDQAMDVS
jgi:hypothetical protein